MASPGSGSKGMDRLPGKGRRKACHHGATAKGRTGHSGGRGNDQREEAGKAATEAGGDPACLLQHRNGATRVVGVSTATSRKTTRSNVGPKTRRAATQIGRAHV